MSLMLNFGDVKNLLRQGLREEADQVAELRADLEQFREQNGSTSNMNPNVNNSRNNARQTIIALQGDDKAQTVIEFGVEGAEKEDNLKEIASNQDNNELIQKLDLSDTNNKNDGTENGRNSQMNALQNDMEQQKNITFLNSQEATGPSTFASPSITYQNNGGDMNELLGMVQYLNVKLEIDVGGRLIELDDSSWAGFLNKLNTAKKALLAALICRGFFLIITAYYSCMSLGSLSQPISRLVVIYFLKNLLVMFFNDQLNKLLVARINLYYKFQGQLLRLKAKMEKLIGKALLQIGEIAKIQQQQSERELESNDKDEGTQNKDKDLLSNSLDKDQEEDDDHKDKDSQVQPLSENSNITPNNNESTSQSSGSFPEQDTKSLLTQENLQGKNQIQEIEFQQKSQQFLPQQPSVPSQIQPLKLKLNKLKLRLTELCEGEMNQSLNDFKRKFDSDNAAANIDLLTKIKSALLVSQPQLTLLSHLLQFLSLIMTISACTLVFKDIPEDTPSSFVLIIWLNIAQDNLQLFAFAALFAVVLSFFVLVFVISRLKRFISKKLHQRKFNQRCKSLPTLVYNPNNANNQPADNQSNVRECSICLADYQEGEVLTQLPCDGKHCFHQECILTWIKVRNDCPLCRKSIF